MEQNDKINNKKSKVLLVITVIVFAAFVIGAAYAYLNAAVDGPKKTPAKITARTIDSLMLSIRDSNDKLQGTDGFKPLSVVVNQDTLSKTSSDTLDYVIATAELTPSNKLDHSITKEYYLNIVIENNTFIYSTEGNKPELLLRVSKKSTGDADFIPIESLPDGTHVVTVTDKIKGDITGFDITTKTGIISVANPETIIAKTDASGVEHSHKDEWKIELIFINYNESQNGNAGKKFKSNIVFGTEAIGAIPIYNDITQGEDSIKVIAPKNLSNGTPIINYTYKIKDLFLNGDYETKESSTPGSNEYIYTNILSGRDYGILVEGTDGNITETVFKTRVSTVNHNLANYIMNCIHTVRSGPGLYHHDGSFKNGEYVLDANDGSYRYSGSNPNNYVCLGECDSINSNRYRIIGVIDGKVKLIKDTPLNVAGSVSVPWDTTGGQYGSNNWNKPAEINKYLNEDADGFYQNLPVNYKDKIASVTWYLGGPDEENHTAKQFYNDEHNSEKVYNGNAFTWTGYVGLMYASDYMYAVPKEMWTLYGYYSDYNAYDMGASNDFRSAVNDDWIYIKDMNQWSITPSSVNDSLAFHVFNDGSVRYVFASYGYLVRPVFNLKSNVMYSSGNGTYELPFII